VQRLGGPDDGLRAIQKKLKELQSKEIVVAVIENLRINLDIHRRILRDEDRNILAWLQSVDTSTNHYLAHKKRDPETGNWLLQLPIFTQWIASKNASFWLQGSPGAGKTVLCSTVIEMVKGQCDQSTDHYAYFYFDFNAKPTRTHIDMLRSIIAQLCTHKKYVPPTLRQLYNTYNREWQPYRHQLLEMLSLLLTTSHRTYVIIDALDECQAESDRDELLITVTEMIAMDNVNILVTSRKENDIEEELEDVVEIKVDLARAKVDSDIAIYVRNRLEKDKQLRKWDRDTKQKIEKVLTERAQGMFAFTPLYG